MANDRSETVREFNEMMRVFLEELRDVFPDDKDVARCLSGFTTLSSVNARKAVDVFVDAVGPYVEQIAARDDTIFGTFDLPGLTIQHLWDGASGATRFCIWQYLDALMSISSRL